MQEKKLKIKFFCCLPRHLMPDFSSSFAGRFYRPLSSPPPPFPVRRLLFPPFAACPLHPPRLADRAALSFPPFVERSYSPGDTIARSFPLAFIKSSFPRPSRDHYGHLRPVPFRFLSSFFLAVTPDAIRLFRVTG